MLLVERELTARGGLEEQSPPARKVASAARMTSCSRAFQNDSASVGTSGTFACY
ncbi:Protein of unknown function [Gryllus bimaculatus]|nr:Protein of unknown function [Gryllus bimaculatus]